MIESRIVSGDREAPALVFLHEGLGSLGMWKDFPDRVASATSRTVVVFSRQGYGQSSPRARPWPHSFMQEEAARLPATLDRLGVGPSVLVGHSDGGSIALLAAAADGARGITGNGSGKPKRFEAVVALAPHVFVEDRTVRTLTAAKAAYASLRPKLARYHRDVDETFGGWIDVWLDPAFRTWNIERELESVECPVLLLQGADDENGTLAQLDAIERRLRGPHARRVLAACGHSPHRDQPDAVIDAITSFLESTEE